MSTSVDLRFGTSFLHGPDLHGCETGLRHEDSTSRCLPGGVEETPPRDTSLPTLCTVVRVGSGVEKGSERQRDPCENRDGPSRTPKPSLTRWSPPPNSCSP